MKILIVEPGKHPYEAEINCSLESLQKTVGGYIEAIYPFEDMVALVCDEESKASCQSSPPSRCHHQVNYNQKHIISLTLSYLPALQMGI